MAVVWKQVTCWTPNDSKVHGSPNAVSSYNFELTQLLFCCRQRAQCWPSERDRHRWGGGVCVLFSTSHKFDLSSVWLLCDFTFRNFHAKLTPSRIMTRYCTYGLFIWYETMACCCGIRRRLWAWGQDLIHDRWGEFRLCNEALSTLFLPALSLSISFTFIMYSLWSCVNLIYV